MHYSAPIDSGLAARECFLRRVARRCSRLFRDVGLVSQLRMN